MIKDVVEIEFDNMEDLKREFESNLYNGGAFCPSAGEVEENQICDVCLVHPATGARLVLPGRVVSLVPTGDKTGAGLAFEGFDAGMRARLTRFVEGGVKPEEPEPGRRKTIHERMRSLSIVEQHRIAREGEVNERIVLERIYGKTVWKEILDNPRVTIPEVTRIAKMGALPLPLVEMIASNRTWLAASQVRRALLTNPRLSREQASRVLATIPRHELKLIPKQTAYPAQVRDLARKILKI